MAKNFFRPYNIVIPASGSTTLNVAGRYIRIVTASESLVITGRDNDKGEVIDSSKGVPAGIELGPFDPPFVSLDFATLSGNAGTATVFISTMGTSVATVAGTVNIIDNTSGRFIALSGNGYSGYTSMTAGAGQFSSLQIWNPANSGVDAVIRREMFRYSAAGNVFRAMYNTELTPDAPQHITNRKLGSANTSKLIMCTESSGAAPRAGSTLLGAFYNAAAGSAILDDRSDEPIVITPGTGYLLTFDAANTNLIGWFDWDEIVAQ